MDDLIQIFGSLSFEMEGQTKNVVKAVKAAKAKRRPRPISDAPKRRSARLQALRESKMEVDK